ncbi:hypothetical protein RxyAA322_01540 [Rubrobacter xylanophilus]|uniref:DUF1440 domain-containing protein n=1 Tax=Rubrobacter xylanophilus TaxID=49319 RepID=A0A510HEC9_9ACTN|nr:hypothetical protein [Rubrobacter xylanophilus]BBL78300.1 hypothetical protein RxyAA322_01540 [Rubrobacter xylanophilus]
MDPGKRAARGGFAGFVATLALSGLRWGLGRVGLVHETAPEQVVRRLEELGLLEGWPPPARRALVVLAHLAYGTGLGASMGILRRLRGGSAEEASVGIALGVLSWGAGWASWLPLAGVHLPPWRQRTPKVLLPLLDHAFFGAVWGLLYRILRGV